MLPAPPNESPLTSYGATPWGDLLLSLRMLCGGSTSSGFPRKTTAAKEGVKGQVRSMWNDSSGRTPKSCSSLFDLKEVV